MSDPLAAFFAKLHHEVTLPETGLTLTVRRPDVETSIGLGELPLPSTRPSSPSGQVPEGPQQMGLREINRYVERVIAEGVVEPPFSDARDDQGKAIYSKHYLHASLLSKEDKGFLADYLFSLMGLTPEVARNVEAFREDSQLANYQESGAGILSPALTGDEVQPG